MTTHRVTVEPASEKDRSYGITHKSTYVYPTATGNNGPTRVWIWNNTRRPNPRAGAQYHGGKYIDPRRKTTDEPVSVLLTPEPVIIDAHGTGTGTPGSGQIYAPNRQPLRLGDTVILVYPDGSEEARVVSELGTYGHGYAHLSN